MCFFFFLLYWAKISGERLQDYLSSGCVFCEGVKAISTKNVHKGP